MKFNSDFLLALQERVLVWDGGMGTQIHAAGLSADDFELRPDPLYPPYVNEIATLRSGNNYDGCNEALVFTRPDVIQAIHERYFAAGSDVVETNTFGVSSLVLAEYNIPELDYELSKQAAIVARRAADKFSGKFVAGAIGPGTKLVSLGHTTFDEIYVTYRDSYLGLIEGGVDVLLIETLQDLLMAKAAIVGAIDAMNQAGKQLPLIAQVTMEQTGTMLVGSEIGAALNMLECFPQIVAIGINCATGPVEMAPHIRYLCQNSTRPISVQPNAGLPVMEGGKAVYKLSPEDLAHHHDRFISEFGVALVGGCCGTTPDHIRAVAQVANNRAHTADCHWRKVQGLYPGFDFDLTSDERASGLSLVGCSSLYQFQPYQQDSSYLIIGEKTNANGSRAFKEMLAAENWEGLTELARELEAEGSHVLDVCTAYVGRDETRDMTTLLQRYNTQITVPIMIDSTEVPVIEASLKCLAGKPLINSINFEDGEGRTRKVLELARRFGAGVVALTIDESGMAKTSERKVEVAERLLAMTREYGLPDHDVFIDCLTFTLGSGDEEFRTAGVETCNAIREITRRHPRVNTTLGVSNISFGLKPSARMVLNSVFLHAAREAGLTSAIVHFSKIQPENRIDPEIWKIADDLVFDRREFAGV
ncbi:MAG: homocysteine S-methyltransferase family protein [Armatimonadetes bacterium]|nr:homocysteine S-methyltransferase family protein [Armatimonadota bacterium]